MDILTLKRPQGHGKQKSRVFYKQLERSVNYWRVWLSQRVDLSSGICNNTAS